MSYSTMTPSALSKMVGERIRQYRLNNNKSQEDLASVAGVTRQTIARIESGKGTLETFMAVLVALDATDNLDALLPPTPVSPIQLAKLMGKERVRASTPRKESAENDKEDDLGW